MGTNNDDSDSDDEIVMDMDDYEDDDPVSQCELLYCVLFLIGCCGC